MSCGCSAVGEKRTFSPEPSVADSTDVVFTIVVEVWSQVTHLLMCDRLMHNVGIQSDNE